MIFVDCCHVFVTSKYQQQKPWIPEPRLAISDRELEEMLEALEAHAAETKPFPGQ